MRDTSTRLDNAKYLRLYPLMVATQDDWMDRYLTYAEAAVEAEEALGFPVAASSISTMCKKHDEITFTSKYGRNRHTPNPGVIDRRVAALELDHDTLGRRIDHLEALTREHIKMMGDHKEKLDALAQAARDGRVTALSEAWRKG